MIHLVLLSNVYDFELYGIVVDWEQVIGFLVCWLIKLHLCKYDSDVVLLACPFSIKSSWEMRVVT